MIEKAGPTGTEYWRDENSGVDTSLGFVPYYDLYYVQEPVEDYWYQDTNAIRATKRMVAMGRIFRCTMKSVFMKSPSFIMRKMFSRGGWSPCKIRRIRCDK